MREAFGSGITPKCEYCKFAIYVGSRLNLRCSIKREMKHMHRCRRFQYDPLKREPLLASAGKRQRLRKTRDS